METSPPAARTTVADDAGRDVSMTDGQVLGHSHSLLRVNKNVGGRSVVGVTGARAGTTMTAAPTCSATSASLVVAASAQATDGTHDSAVSATAIWRKRRRAERLRRLSTARSTPPITAPTKVSWAKSTSGIILPPTLNDTQRRGPRRRRDQQRRWFAAATLPNGWRRTAER